MISRWRSSIGLGSCMLVFYQLNDDKDGWDEFGRIKNGEVISDETGHFEDWIGEEQHYPEEHLAEQYNNHYINAVIAQEEDDK
jgi:hypothetical protein